MGAAILGGERCPYGTKGLGSSRAAGRGRCIWKTHQVWKEWVWGEDSDHNVSRNPGRSEALSSLILTSPSTKHATYIASRHCTALSPQTSLYFMNRLLLYELFVSAIFHTTCLFFY